MSYLLQSFHCFFVIFNLKKLDTISHSKNRSTLPVTSENAHVQAWSKLLEWSRCSCTNRMSFSIEWRQRHVWCSAWWWWWWWWWWNKMRSSWRLRFSNCYQSDVIQLSHLELRCVKNGTTLIYRHLQYRDTAVLSVRNNFSQNRVINNCALHTLRKNCLLYIFGDARCLLHCVIWQADDTIVDFNTTVFYIGISHISSLI